MLEIIVLIFVCKKMGNLAVHKGLKPFTWKLYTVLAWIFAEITGVLIGLQLFGQNNLIGIMMLGMVSAFGGYLYVKYILDSKPDSYDEDINRIGADDLHPPRK